MNHSSEIFYEVKIVCKTIICVRFHNSRKFSEIYIYFAREIKKKTLRPQPLTFES